MVYDVRIWADSFAYPATEVTSAAMPSPMPQGSLSETACNRVNTFFLQSLTCILRRYLDHQNIPIKTQTSTIMAGRLGSCTATILLVDWTISNYGFKILFWSYRPTCRLHSGKHHATICRCISHWKKWRLFLSTKNWTFGARNRHELQGPPTVPQPQTLTRAFSWALRELRTQKKRTIFWWMLLWRFNPTLYCQYC